MTAWNASVDFSTSWSAGLASLREPAAEIASNLIPFAPAPALEHERSLAFDIDAIRQLSLVAEPRVWVLTSPRAGDASQVLALAEALGWPFDVKRFKLQPYELLVAPPFRASAAGIRKAESSPLTPPWPNLVLSSGRENEPIARWIKQQSGGRTRIVHIGRPWGRLDAYDLVITTPQYRLPRRSNVLHNTAPLHRITRERLDEAGATWAERLAHLPRPLITVLVGGSSGPYALTRHSGERLALAASALAARLGGSLLVTTSARTPKTAIKALEEGITCPHVLYRWKRGDKDNPYFAFLGLADEIIVTADSISMITEACATGKPVHLFDLGVGWSSMRAPIGLPGEKAEAKPGLREWLRDFNLKARFYRFILKHAPARVTRDIRLVHADLVASGRATWLGEPLPSATPLPLNDMARAVTRVRALVARGAEEPQRAPVSVWTPKPLAAA